MERKVLLGDIDQLRLALRSGFGPESDLIVGSTGGEARCSLVVVLAPCVSREKTESEAWSLVGKLATWMLAHEHDLGSPGTAEIMVALPNDVRETKRRLLRVGGSADQWREALRTGSRAPLGEGSYTYLYDKWAEGIDSWA